MATIQEDGEAQPGSTAYLLQEMQLYGHRPFEDEPDHRPLPDDRIAGGAVAEMFDALVSCLIDTRIEPDLEDLAWGIVNVFDRAGERIERELDDNEQAQRRMQKLPEERTRLLASAFASNLYAPLIGEGATSAGGV